MRPLADGDETGGLDGELQTLIYHLALWIGGGLHVSNAGIAIEDVTAWSGSDLLVVALGVVGLAAVVHSVHALATARYLSEATPDSAVTYVGVLLLAALGFAVGLTYAPG